MRRSMAGRRRDRPQTRPVSSTGWTAMQVEQAAGEVEFADRPHRGRHGTCPRLDAKRAAARPAMPAPTIMRVAFFFRNAFWSRLAAFHRGHARPLHDRTAPGPPGRFPRFLTVVPAPGPTGRTGWPPGDPPESCACPTEPDAGPRQRSWTNSFIRARPRLVAWYVLAVVEVGHQPLTAKRALDRSPCPTGCAAGCPPCPPASFCRRTVVDQIVHGAGRAPFRSRRRSGRPTSPRAGTPPWTVNPGFGPAVGAGIGQGFGSGQARTASTPSRPQTRSAVFLGHQAVGGQLAAGDGDKVVNTVFAAWSMR